MNPYRPTLPGPLAAGLGTWAATGRPARTATVTFDPRLAAWLVNAAAKRSALIYVVKRGRPSLTVTLV